MALPKHKRSALIGSVLISVPMSLWCAAVQAQETVHYPKTDTVKYAQLEAFEDAPIPAAVEEDFYALDVPVTLNQAYLGDVSIDVTLSGYARIKIPELKAVMADRLSDKQATLLDSFGDEPTLLQALRDTGFLIIYDPSELTIKVNLPREGVEQIRVSGRNLENLSLENVQEPAKFSAGVGFVARPRYIHYAENGDTGLAPLTADMRGFLSLGGFQNWSLTYELNYQEGRSKLLQRGDITLTRDNFEKAIRFQAGDIRPSIIGFQAGLDLLGVSLERNYGAIQPFRNLRPGGRNSFVLEREARVTYEVNGVTLGGQRLEAGTYDVGDFPLITGANDVRIVVDDEFGVREVGAYSTFVDSDLLSKGTTLFGVNAGVRPSAGRGASQRSYDSDPVALGYIETGLTDSLTLGSQIEASENGGFLGGRAIYGFGNNVFALEGGLSQFSGFQTGTAIALRYSNRPFRVTGGRNNQFDAQISYQSGDFLTLGSNGLPRGELWSATVRDNFSVGRHSYSLNASWRKSDFEETVGIGSTWRLPIETVSISLGYNGDYSVRNDDFDNRVFITLSKNFGAYGSTRSRLATGPNEAELEWRRLSTRGIGEWSGRASYLSSEIEDEVSADASYIASRAELSVSHSTLFENGGGRTVSSVTDGRIGAGFGFADGSFALGRPVSNGFFILNRHQTIKDNKINVFQSGDQKSGQTDVFGSSLVPLTGAYRQQTHRVDIEDLPAGYDIGSGQIEVFPSYNSGYKITIGSDPAALVMGVLKNGDDTPVSLVTGRLEPINAPSRIEDGAANISFFTNRTGRFVAERVPAGRYRLILMPGDRVIKKLDIGEGEDGVFRVGTIVIEED